MNDAWLLGGVHKRMSFHLVTEGLGQQKLVAAMDGLNRQALFQQRVARFGQVHPPSQVLAKKVEAVWLQWFRDNPEYLYETWGPRVLTRELIGLMTFGYQPSFRREELGFACADGKRASDATIEGYSRALNDLGFHQGKDQGAKRKVLSALSKWLFGNSDALF
jgi:hypothetical protein